MAEVKILLVDIDKEETMNIKLALKSYSNVFCITSDELNDKLPEVTPDIVLIDPINIRSKSLTSTLEKIKIPIIYLLSNFNEVNKQSIFEPYYYLIKPVDPVELNYVVKLSFNKYKIQAGSENYYKAIFEQTGIATVIIDEDTIISKANPEFEILSGYSREELEGKKSWADFVKEEDLGRMKEYHYLRRADPTAAPLIYDFKFIDRTGVVKNIHLDIRMIPGTKLSVASLLDITELKHAQILESNRESEFSSIYNTISEVIYSVSVDENDKYRFLSVNQAFLDATGLEESQIVGKYVEDVIPEPSLSMVLKNYKKAIKERRMVQWEEITDYPSGRKYGDVTITPFCDTGRCTKLVGTVHDISEIMEMQGELLFKTTILEAQLESTLDGIMVVDMDMNLILYNKRFLEMWNIPMELLENNDTKKIIDYIKQELKDKDSLKENMKNLIGNRDKKTFKNIEFNDGRIFESYSSPLIDSLGKFDGRIWYFRDITESKRAEKELMDSKNKYSALFDNAEDGIFLMRDNLFIECNNKVLEMYKVTREQIIGKSPIEFSPGIQPDGEKSESKALSLIKKAYNGKPQHFEWVHLTYDGTPFTVEVSLNRLKIKDEYLIQAIVRDVTERKKSEDKINKLYRLYATLSQINQAVVRTDDRSELFETICKVCVDYGNFIMAWIGLIDYDTGDILPVEHYGFEDGYLDKISLNIKDSPNFKKPSIMAVENKQFSICENIERDLNRNWRDEALKRNYRSLVSIPLKKKGEIIGILNIYSSTPNFFKEEEIDLIKEMGLDISFALDSMETRKDKKEIEHALKESERSYRELVDYSLVGVYKTNVNGDVLFANDAMANLYKFKDVSEMEKNKITTIYKKKEDRLKFLNDLKNEGFLRDYEMETVDQNGETVNVLVSARLKNDTISGMFMDITDRKKSETLLSNSEKKYRKLYSSMNEGAALHRLIYDKNDHPVDYEIIDANQAYEKILGIKKYQIIGKTAKEVYNTEEAPYLDIYSEVAQKGTSTNFETYFEPMQKYFNISVFSPAPDTFATVFEDITIRKKEENLTKKSLEEKEVLLREIHHRVKNNLQIIASLLNLQESTENQKNVGDVLKESMGRVKTMATIHEKLYESPSLNDINFRNFTEKLVYDILYSYGIPIGTIKPHIDMDDISLNIDTAMPLGLIINELVTNSVKYAFPKKEGNINITLKSLPEHMVLIVSDDGIGMPKKITPEESDTLGLKLVTNLVDQLEGSFELKREGGTEFAITFKEIKYKKRM